MSRTKRVLFAIFGIHTWSEVQVQPTPLPEPRPSARSWSIPNLGWAERALEQIFADAGFDETIYILCMGGETFPWYASERVARAAVAFLAGNPAGRIRMLVAPSRRASPFVRAILGRYPLQVELTVMPELPHIQREITLVTTDYADCYWHTEGCESAAAHFPRYQETIKWWTDDAGVSMLQHWQWARGSLNAPRAVA